MRFGICGAVEQSAAFKAAGADFIEVGVQTLTQPLLSDEQWTGMALKAKSALPILAANVLLPGTHRVTGPDVDPEKLRGYLARVMARAAKVGMETIVFGSGGARKIPDGFSRDTAWKQLIEFASSCATAAKPHGITVVAEPLNRSECNVMNSVGECARIVEAVNHPNFRLLVDSYHFWIENDSLDALARLMPIIRHVHVADKDGRVFPGESGTADYRPFFAVLKAGGYEGPISIEAMGDPGVPAARAMAYLRREWQAA